VTTPPSWEQVAKTRELDIYEREIAAGEREVAAKESELKKSRWTNPLVLLLVGAVIALFGNAVVAYLNNRNTQEVERMRSQSNLILEAIRTGSPEKACTNLVAIINLGLLDDDPAKTIRRNCLTSPSTGPYLPLRTATYLPTGPLDLKLMINGIQGVVVDADSHQPISKAIVTMEGLEKVETDAEGQFHLGIPPFTNKLAYSIAVEKGGYQSTQVWAPAVAGSLISIELHKK
jgi:hypothetical protein